VSQEAGVSLNKRSSEVQQQQNTLSLAHPQIPAVRTCPYLYACTTPSSHLDPPCGDSTRNPRHFFDEGKAVAAAWAAV